MHLIHHFRRMPFRGQILLHGHVHHRDESQYVAQRHEGRRTRAVDLVLLRRGVPQRDFLLVVDPVLIVRPQAGVQDPLLKAKVAPGQIFWVRVAFRRAGMAREVRDARYDPAAPVFDDCFV